MPKLDLIRVIGVSIALGTPAGTSEMRLATVILPGGLSYTQADIEYGQYLVSSTTLQGGLVYNSSGRNMMTEIGAAPWLLPVKFQ